MEDNKKYFEDTKKQLIEYINSIQLKEDGSLSSGLIFIPVSGVTPEKPTLFGYCDPDILKYRMALLDKNLRDRGVEMKINSLVKDQTDRDMLLREAFGK